MGDAAEDRLAAQGQPRPAGSSVLCWVLRDVHNAAALHGEGDSSQGRDAPSASLVYLIANVGGKLEPVLTFCGVSEAVLGPYLYEAP